MTMNFDESHSVYVNNRPDAYNLYFHARSRLQAGHLERPSRIYVWLLANGLYTARDLGAVLDVCVMQEAQTLFQHSCTAERHAQHTRRLLWQELQTKTPSRKTVDGWMRLCFALGESLALHDWFDKGGEAIIRKQAEQSNSFFASSILSNGGTPGRGNLIFPRTSEAALKQKYIRHAKPDKVERCSKMGAWYLENVLSRHFSLARQTSALLETRNKYSELAAIASNVRRYNIVLPEFRRWERIAAGPPCG